MGRKDSGSIKDFLVERAGWLAAVLLTRRDDVQVAKAAGEEVPSLRATILRSGRPSRRLFEVILKAAVLPEGGMRAAAPAHIDLSLDDETADLYRAAPFPTVLFFADMRSDEGLFRWVMEPITDGSPSLVFRPNSPAFPLTDDAIDAIVGRVNEWYDAREAGATRSLQTA